MFVAEAPFLFQICCTEQRLVKLSKVFSLFERGLKMELKVLFGCIK